MAQDFQRDYLVRLPLPLAKLYSRAYNDKDARSRHDNTFYLFEALVKLATAPAVAAYLHEIQHGAPRVAALDHLLAQLALPSLGQWVAMLRELARHFGQRPDAASHPLGHLWEQLNRPYRDRPALLALYRRIKNGPDGKPAGDSSCSLLQVLEALVQYRNGIFGHGAGRFAEFYEQEMGPLLFPAANEVLAEGMLDLLGPRGSRLVYLTELRILAEDRIELNLRELVGMRGERMAPLTLDPARAAGLDPNQVAVLWPGHPVPLRLDPLLRYRESELTDEVLFLNRDRDGRQVEYLSYTTGRTERDRATAPALAALLSQIIGPRDQRGADGGPGPAEHGGDTLRRGALGSPPTGRAAAGRLRDPGRDRTRWHGGGLPGPATLPGPAGGPEVAPRRPGRRRDGPARFRREIRALARCDHPHIVKVLESGTMPDGQSYYTMEYVPGCDLDQVWCELAGAHRQGDASTLGSSTWARAVLSASRKRRDQAASRHSHRSATESPEPTPASSQEQQTAPVAESAAAPAEPIPALPLPPLPELPSAADDPGGYVRRVVTLLRDAALAVQAVHDQQIVHRDVKPANLMLTPDGSRIVLMDFGLAKGQSLTTSESRRAGLLGTLRYAAPEQLAAATLKVGPPADVRGLGVTLWELLTRRRLFDDAADERQLATMVHDHDVPRLRTVDPSLDRDLEAIVARATERRVADRIPTAGKLAEYLQLYLDGKPLPIRPPSNAEMLWRWVRRNPAVASLMVAFLLSLVIGLIGVTYEWQRVKEQRDEANAARTRAETAEVQAKRSAAKAEAINNFLLNACYPRRRRSECPQAQDHRRGGAGPCGRADRHGVRPAAGGRGGNPRDNRQHLSLSGRVRQGRAAL